MDFTDQLISDMHAILAAAYSNDLTELDAARLRAETSITKALQARARKGRWKPFTVTGRLAPAPGLHEIAASFKKFDLAGGYLHPDGDAMAYELYLSMCELCGQRELLRERELAVQHLGRLIDALSACLGRSVATTKGTWLNQAKAFLESLTGKPHEPAMTVK